MAQEQKNRRYDELFPNLEEKAAAFDQIAAQFYEGNFGRMSKADLETLMFHLYIEQILKRSEQDFHTYSDFRLSKELGIPQSRVSSLKVKKQLQYPRNFMNRPRLCRQHKKPRVQDYTVLAGVAQCQRRHSCFRLDALVVVKVDVTVNHLIGF